MMMMMMMMRGKINRRILHDMLQFGVYL